MDHGKYVTKYTALMLAAGLATGCGTSMPKYNWRPLDPSMASKTPEALQRDQAECLPIANQVGQDSAVIFIYTAEMRRKEAFKNCMESRGWQKVGAEIK